MTERVTMSEVKVLQSSRRTKAMLLSSYVLLNGAVISMHIEEAVTTLIPVVVTVNIGAYLLQRLIHHTVIQPIRQIRAILRRHPTMSLTAAQHSYNLMQLAHDIDRLSETARDYYHQHHLQAQELETVRRAMAEISHQHALLMSVTEREARQHYQSVMTYAHYLEERILAKQADATLRFDFDDTCESSFALALITNALSQLNSKASCAPVALSLSDMLQHTLIKLSAALDRRNMRLDSRSVDLTTAYADANLVQLAVWVMLLGAVRYAQDESTLKLRTLTSRDGKSAILSIVISELSPGAMTHAERADYLDQMLRHTSPHLFAQAIQNHANLVLANALLARTQGHAQVTPLTAMSCEIAITLPRRFE